MSADMKILVALQILEGVLAVISAVEDAIPEA